ncbi:signal peptidase I [Candidatus Gottesmanbacteria bacterium]|nr:signal peptidase I [Candidatus Gottesmanbacteria bacterium]
MKLLVTVAVTLLAVLSLSKPFVVLSGSMRPAIKEGAVVFVQRSVKNIKVGDVITFIHPANPAQTVTHRVVEITKTGFKTKGDANNTADPWEVRREAVWGRVLFSVNLLGFLVSFAQTKIGVIFLIALPLILIALSELRVVFKELKIFFLFFIILIFSTQTTYAVFISSNNINNVTIATASSFGFINNGSFAQGLFGWTISGDVATASSDLGIVARIGQENYASDAGKFVWENSLMQTFSAGPKTLLLDYNFFTKDSAPFDDPGFFIRLNGQEVFATSSASSSNSGWRQFVYDLSSLSATSSVNLALYAGNTGDTANQSWVDVTNIITNYASNSAAIPFAIATLSATTVGSNFAVLDWEDTGINKYNLQFSTQENFSLATPAAVFKPPLEILGLTPETTYYFALKAGSIFSEILTATTSAGLTVNSGDIIIQEIKWSEYLKLRNLTDRVIDLSGFQIAGAILPDGTLINAHDNFLINSGLTFPANQELELLDSANNIIDRAANTGGPLAQRIPNPGDGTDPMSWFRPSNPPLLTLTSASQSASFNVTNTQNYVKLNYELTYDTDTVSQGAVGQIKPVSITPA